MAETTHTDAVVFDWHAERTVTPGGLLYWLIPAVLPRQGDEVERLSQLTDRFTRCELTMQLNGTPLNVSAFLDGVARWVADTAREEAARLVGEVGLEEIEDAVSVARDAIRSTLHARLRAAGVAIGEDDGG